MSTPKWQPSRLYAPGSLVTPRTSAPALPAQLPNGNFDTDASGWSLQPIGSASIEWQSTGGYSSPGCIRFAGAGEANDGSIRMSPPQQLTPGQQISLRAMGRMPGGTDGTAWSISLLWLDEDGDLIGRADSQTMWRYQQGTGWKQASVSGYAPAAARSVVAYVQFNASSSGTTSTIFVDDISWNFTSPPSTDGLQYRATQAGTGYSGSTEPVWPATLGQQVVDNEVTWEAVRMSRVVWEARPILRTGATEPEWPDTIGTNVPDGTISWRASNPITQDTNCPQTRVVAIAKFKVFAADKDVVRFTATLAPQDWTSEQDAGYLGVGLNQGSANHVSMLNVYRANLVVMNPVIFQQWQIDPDPALMDMLDRMDGIGSSWHLAAVPVADDLFYLSNRGVRTVGVSGATHNLKSGDVGLPVDPIVSELTAELVARNAAGANEQPLGMYLPGMGQYWLSYNRIVPNDPGDAGPEIGSPRDLCPTLSPGGRYAEVMVYTLTQVGQVGAWSRYVFPFAIDDWAQEGDDLYVRDGDRVFRLSEELGATDLYADGDGGVGLPFDAIIQWPWLDMGRPGQDKQMESFDFVGYGSAEIEFGYDQSEPGWFTEPYLVDPDTVPAQSVPMALTSPSYSVRIRYHGWDPADTETAGQRHWSFNAMAINLV